MRAAVASFKFGRARARRTQLASLGGHKTRPASPFSPQLFRHFRPPPPAAGLENRRRLQATGERPVMGSQRAAAAETFCFLRRFMLLLLSLLSLLLLLL